MTILNCAPKVRQKNFWGALWNMKRLYVRFHSSDPKLQQAVVVLPWGHINHLITKFGDDDNAPEVELTVRVDSTSLNEQKYCDSPSQLLDSNIILNFLSLLVALGYWLF